MIFDRDVIGVLSICGALMFFIFFAQLVDNAKDKDTKEIPCQIDK